MPKEKVDHKALLAAFMESAPKEYGMEWTVQKEHKFHPIRRWRFDYIWVDADGKGTGIAVEFDGIFGGRSHSSIPGIMRDQEKLNNAQLIGWRVYRSNARTIEDGSFFNFMRAVLAQYASVGA